MSTTMNSTTTEDEFRALDKRVYREQSFSLPDERIEAKRAKVLRGLKKQLKDANTQLEAFATDTSAFVVAAHNKLASRTNAITVLEIPNITTNTLEGVLEDIERCFDGLDSYINNVVETGKKELETENQQLAGDKSLTALRYTSEAEIYKLENELKLQQVVSATELDKLENKLELRELQNTAARDKHSHSLAIQDLTRQLETERSKAQPNPSIGLESQLAQLTLEAAKSKSSIKQLTQELVSYETEDNDLRAENEVLLQQVRLG